MENRQQKEYVAGELKRLIKEAPEIAETHLTEQELNELASEGERLLDARDCLYTIPERSKEDEKKIQDITSKIAALDTKVCQAQYTVSVAVPDSVQYSIFNQKSILQEFLKRVEKGFKLCSGKISAFPSKHIEGPKHTLRNIPSLHLPSIPAKPVIDINKVKKLAEPFASQDPTREVITRVYWDNKRKSVVATSGRLLFVMKKPRGISWTGWKTEGTYLNYTQVIPGFYKHTATIDTLCTLQKVIQASYVKPDDELSIFLSLGNDGELAVQADHVNVGAYLSDNHYGGTPIAFCSHVYMKSILETLAKLGHDKVEMKWNDDKSPMEFAAGTVRIVIMVMRK